MKRLFIPPHLYRANFCVRILLLASLVFSVGCERKHGVKTGEIPPEIFGTDIHGGHISLKQFKGKVIIIYFWTNSCCGDKVKLLEPYYVRNKDKGLVILAINVSNTRETVRSYAKNNGVTFTLQTDEDSIISREYGVFGFPTIFIIDRQGIVRKKFLGYAEPVQLEKYVESYLTIR